VGGALQTESDGQVAVVGDHVVALGVGLAAVVADARVADRHHAHPLRAGDVGSASTLVVAVPTFLLENHYTRAFEASGRTNQDLKASMDRVAPFAKPQKPQ